MRKCEAHGEHTIELDTPPGAPRPGDLITKILKGTGLKEREPIGKFFGNWTWDYSDIPCEEWDKVQLITQPKIERLYHGGVIRYGSW